MAKAGVLRAFLISGFLLALPGGLLPLWGYHVDSEFGTAGNYFLAMGLGMAVAMGVARKLAGKCAADRVLTCGCFLSSLALLMLTIAAPPALIWYQMVCLVVTGAAAGLVNHAIFETIGPAWEADPAGVTLRAGVYFGAGSVLASVAMAESFGGATIGDTSAMRTFAISAALPIIAAFAFRRLPAAPPAQEVAIQDEDDEATRARRTVLATLLGLLLVFQFANVWGVAGWLPIYLIDRLGMSPVGAVMLLAMYWMAITAGRMGAPLVMRLMPHGRMLGISAFCALFGGTALAAADTRGGVVIGILLMGFGFAAIYPLALERISTRFTGYHPGYFSNLFLCAMSGGMFAAFAIGHVAAWSGLRAIPVAAMLGSCTVFVLLLMIWLGRKVSGN